MWVKKARLAFTLSAIRIEFSTVECVGCGLCRKRIQEQNVEPLQLRERCFRNFAEICQVGRGAEPIAVDFCLPMNHRYRFKSLRQTIRMGLSMGFSSSRASPPNL